MCIRDSSQGTELNDETAPADYAAILDAIAAALPGERAQKFHAHFSRIAYTKGCLLYTSVPICKGLMTLYHTWHSKCKAPLQNDRKCAKIFGEI